jgi:hypothetical protein
MSSGRVDVVREAEAGGAVDPDLAFTRLAPEFVEFGAAEADGDQAAVERVVGCTDEFEIRALGGERVSAAGERVDAGVDVFGPELFEEAQAGHEARHNGAVVGADLHEARGLGGFVVPAAGDDGRQAVEVLQRI